MEELLNKFMAESEKRHNEHSSLIKEIRASTGDAIRNQGASIKALEIRIGQMSKVCQEGGSGSLPSSTKINPRDHVKSITTSKEAKTLKGNDKIPLIKLIQTTIPFSACLRKLLKEKSRIEEEIKAIIKVHCSAILKDALPPKEKDPESCTLPCSISNMCFDKALADLGASVSVVPYSTFTNLGLDKDLDPQIEDGDIIDKLKVDIVKIRHDDEIIERIDEYPNFAIVKDTDAYRDKHMGDVIVGKPFCRVACVKAKREVLSKNDESGGMHIIWNLMCASHAGIQTLFRNTTHNVAHKLIMEDHTEQIPWEFSFEFFIFPIFHLQISHEIADQSATFKTIGANFTNLVILSAIVPV
ncbi:hypothetical protein Tco_0379049 [Tanacetum coccineum]